LTWQNDFLRRPFSQPSQPLCGRTVGRITMNSFASETERTANSPFMTNSCDVLLWQGLLLW